MKTCTSTAERAAQPPSGLRLAARASQAPVGAASVSVLRLTSLRRTGAAPPLGPRLPLSVGTVAPSVGIPFSSFASIAAPKPDNIELGCCFCIRPSSIRIILIRQRPCLRAGRRALAGRHSQSRPGGSICACQNDSCPRAPSSLIFGISPRARGAPGPRAPAAPRGLAGAPGPPALSPEQPIPGTPNSLVRGRVGLWPHGAVAVVVVALVVVESSLVTGRVGVWPDGAVVVFVVLVVVESTLVRGPAY